MAVVGISRDSPYSHIEWSRRLSLDYPLLSDWNAEAVRGFGVARDYRGMKEVAERTAFLVGIDGSVLGAWRYEDSEVPDFDVLLAAVKELESAEPPG